MGKYQVRINRGGETLKIEIRDGTYKIIHRGTYRMNNKKDLYYMLSTIEKFIPFTINQILNMGSEWL